MPGRSISYPVSNSYHFQQLAVSIGQFLAEPPLKATGRGLSYEHASVWYFLTEIKCRGDAFSILFCPIYFGRTGRCGWRRRTPGPPPFSAMNSTPAFSRAFRNFTIVRSCAASAPGWVSSRFTLGSEIPEASARSRCSHRRRDRAARTCSLVRLNLIPQVLTSARRSFNTSGIA